MAAETGKGIPPDPTEVDLDGIDNYMKACKDIRISYPGLSTNILSITISHLLGWDMTKSKNKPNEGLFGNLTRGSPRLLLAWAGYGREWCVSTVCVLHA